MVSPRLTEALLEEAARRGLDISAVGRLENPPSLEELIEQTCSFKLHEWQKWVCERLQALRFQTGQRILIHGPPQWGKSILVSKRFPAWMLGVRPLSRIVLAAYNVTHAAGFGEVVRDVMQSPMYQDLFPRQASRVPTVCSGEKFSTQARSSQFDDQASFTAVGLLSGFTGRGADLLIIDDPYASPDDARSEAINERVWRWWTELAKVRINDDTNVVVMFHRYHEDDFAGRLLAEGGWEYLRFPAIADENEDGSDPTGRRPGEALSPIRSRAFIQEIEDRDPQTYIGQFQGRPRPAEGGFIKRQWLQTATMPELNLMVRYWDLAVSAKQTADFTAGAKVGVDPKQVFCLFDMERWRKQWPDAHERIAQVTIAEAAEAKAKGFRYAAGIEAVASMEGYAQQLMASVPGVQWWPRKHKVNRKKEDAAGWVAAAAQDRFRMAVATWNQDFINECLAFDGLGLTHDDQVDAVSGGWDLVWQLKGGLHEPKEPIPDYQVAAPDALAKQLEQRRRTERGRGVFADGD